MTTNDATPREAIATAIQNANNNYVTSGAYPMTPKTEWQADSVIAHLWQRADDPEVVEAVRDCIYDTLEGDADTNILWQEAAAAAPKVIRTLLTALIGPRPSGGEAADER